MKRWYQKSIVATILIVLCQLLFFFIPVRAADTEKEDPYLDINITKEYTYHTFSLTNDPYSSYQWALENTGLLQYQELLLTGKLGRTVYSKVGMDIRLQEAWAYYKKKAVNREIIIAIIDTGVDTNQKDLRGHLWINTLEKSNRKDDDQNGLVDDIHGWNFYDGTKQLYNYSDYNKKTKQYEDDHGTHCAGTIVATPNNGIGIAGIAGVANVKLMVIKALGGIEGSEVGTGGTSSIIKAIRYAERMGAQICNLSFGGDEVDEALKSTMKNSKMLFICASGNEGKNIDKKPVYPASYDLPNIISVGNMNSDGTLSKTSNYGVESVDLVAPGSEIISTLVKNSYGTMTGTSMSAPMVTGASALLYSFYPSMTATDAKKIILKSVTPIKALKNKVKTGGMLNVEKMLKTKYTPSKANNLSVSLSLKNKKASTAKILQISVKDRRDLVEVRVARGDFTIKDFQKKTIGKALSRKKSQSYTIHKSGTYTVYVKDRAGEEKVKKVKVNIQLSFKNKSKIYKSKVSLLE